MCSLAFILHEEKRMITSKCAIKYHTIYLSILLRIREAEQAGTIGLPLNISMYVHRFLYVCVYICHRTVPYLYMRWSLELSLLLLYLSSFFFALNYTSSHLLHRVTTSLVQPTVYFSHAAFDDHSFFASFDNTTSMRCSLTRQFSSARFKQIVYERSWVFLIIIQFNIHWC